MPRFIELLYFAPMYVLNSVDRAQKFEDGLREDVQSRVTIMRIQDYSEPLKRAKLVKGTLERERSLTNRRS